LGGGTKQEVRFRGLDPLLVAPAGKHVLDVGKRRSYSDLEYPQTILSVEFSNKRDLLAVRVHTLQRRNLSILFEFDHVPSTEKNFVIAIPRDWQAHCDINTLPSENVS
jgi:hypothetical protein